MTEQHLILDWKDISPLRGSLIHSDTNILNLYIDDGTHSTNCEAVGNSMEWKPYLWLQHEKNRLRLLKKLRVIICEGKIPKWLKGLINQTADTEVEFFELLLSGSYKFYEDAKRLPKQDSIIERDKKTYYSVGTMRFPRLIIAHWLQKNKVDVGKPKIGNERLSILRQQISRIGSYDTSDYEDIENRYFGNLHEDSFKVKQSKLFHGHRIAIVSEQPWFDYMENFLCEKFADPVACKCLPFFIGNGDDNQHITRLGFKSYVGFSYDSLQKSNFIERWTALLEDNRVFLLESFYNESIYDMNRDIIDYNYEHLHNTDWEEKARLELQQLPQTVKDKIIYRFFSYGSSDNLTIKEILK